MSENPARKRAGFLFLRWGILVPMQETQPTLGAGSPPVSPAAPLAPPSPAEPASARGVAEMLELAFEAIFQRFKSILAVSGLLWLVVLVPSLAGDWLQLKWLRSLAEQGFFQDAIRRLMAGEFAAAQMDEVFEQLVPSGGVAFVSGTLGSFSSLVSIAAKPIAAGALTLLVASVAVGVPVASAGAWRGALRRALPLVLTQLVKAIFLTVIGVASVVAAILLAAVLAPVLGALGGISQLGPAGKALWLALSTMAAGTIALGPAVYCYLLWIFTVPLVLFEDLDLLKALRRSAALVREHRPGGFWRSHEMRLTLLLTLAALVIVLGYLPSIAPWAVWAKPRLSEILSGRFERMDRLLAVPGSVFFAWSGLFFLAKVFLAALVPGVIVAYYLDVRGQGPPAGLPDPTVHLAALCSSQGMGKAAEPAAAVPAAPAAPPLGARPGLPPHWPDGPSEG